MRKRSPGISPICTTVPTTRSSRASWTRRRSRPRPSGSLRQGGGARCGRVRRGGGRARADRVDGRPRDDLRAAPLLDEHGRSAAWRARAADPGGRPRPLSTQLLFFGLEWAAVDDERAETLLADDSLADYRHWLEASPLPAAPADRARRADHDREVGLRLVVVVAPLLGAPLGPARRARRRGAVHGGRARAAAGRRPGRAPHRRRGDREGLAPGLRTRSFVFNAILLDKSIDDRLRDYPTWISSRNLANEVSDEAVQALVDAVVSPERRPAAVLPAEGAAPRPRPPGALRPRGAVHRRDELHELGRRAAHLRRGGAFSDKRARSSTTSSRRAGSTRPSGRTRRTGPSARLRAEVCTRTCS